MEPPWGIEPQASALRVTRRTSETDRVSTAGVRRCALECGSGNCVGCSIGCSATSDETDPAPRRAMSSRPCGPPDRSASPEAAEAAIRSRLERG
jgi:hypothetical protein